jgi:hypothetical protein
MGPPFGFKLVMELGSENRLPGWCSGRGKNRHKRPTLVEGRMFMDIWKSYIWMLGDIPENEATFGFV